jgi:hypothetical protein
MAAHQGYYVFLVPWMASVFENDSVGQKLISQITEKQRNTVLHEYGKYDCHP